jgi:hypothetical protein
MSATDIVWAFIDKLKQLRAAAKQNTLVFINIINIIRY